MALNPNPNFYALVTFRSPPATPPAASSPPNAAASQRNSPPEPVLHTPPEAGTFKLGCLSYSLAATLRTRSSNPLHGTSHCPSVSHCTRSRTHTLSSLSPLPYLGPQHTLRPSHSQLSSYSHSPPTLDLATLHSTLFLYFVSRPPEIALKLSRTPSTFLAKSALRLTVWPPGSRVSTPYLTPLQPYRAYDDRVQL